MKYSFSAARTALAAAALLASTGLGFQGCRRQVRSNPADPMGSNFQPSVTQTRTPSPTPSPFPAPDSYENDDAYSLGDPLLPASPQSRSLFPSGDADWATLTLGQMGEIIVETSGAAGDTLLFLYDSSGALLLASDDNSGVGLFSSITAVLPPGTYTILVEENGDNAAIPGYTLSLSLRDLSATPTFTETQTFTETPTSTATPSSTPECPETIQGELFGSINGAPVTGTTVGGGNQFFGTCNFTTSADRVYTLTLPSLTDVTVSLCASSYNSLLVLRTSCFDDTSQVGCNDDACGTGGTRSRLIMPSLPQGRYYVVVDGAGAAGVYSLSVTSP